MEALICQMHLDMQKATDHAPRDRHRRPLVIMLLLCLALLGWLQHNRPPIAPGENNIALSTFIVIDGDTIRSPAGVTYRLLNFDAPETYRAKCEEEHAAGLKAKVRLEQFIASGNSQLIESGRSDHEGRTLAILMIKGDDVAQTMIAEGLARPYYGERPEGWCMR